MKQTPIGRLIAGLALSGLANAGTPGIVSEALKYDSTSVVPTLPTPQEARAMREATPHGIVPALQHAHRRSLDQGWTGIPALNPNPHDDTGDVSNLRLSPKGGSRLSPFGD